MGLVTIMGRGREEFQLCPVIQVRESLMALAQLSDSCEAEVDSQLCGVGRGHEFTPRWSSLCSCPLRTDSMGIVGAQSHLEQRFVLILGQRCFMPAAAWTSTASTCEGRSLP